MQERGREEGEEVRVEGKGLYIYHKQVQSSLTDRYSCQ